MKKQKEEPPQMEQEFGIWELENLGELVLEKIRRVFVRLDDDLDDTYTIDYHLKLFEKIHHKYLKQLQIIHLEKYKWETEQTLKMLKFEKQLMRKKKK